MSKWWQSSYFCLEFWHSARSITGRVERSQTSRCARWRERERKFCVPVERHVYGCYWKQRLGRALAGIKWSRSLTAQIQFKAHKSKARLSLSNIVAKINPAFISIHLTFGMRAGVAICKIWMGGASGVIGFHVQKHCDIANWDIILIYHRKYFFSVVCILTSIQVIYLQKLKESKSRTFIGKKMRKCGNHFFYFR